MSPRCDAAFSLRSILTPAFVSHCSVLKWSSHLQKRSCRCRAGSWRRPMSGRVVEGGLVARNSHSEEPRSLFVLCPKLASLAFISLLASLAFSSVPCLLLWSLCSSYTAMLAALALFLCVILPRSLRSRLVSLLASLALLLCSLASCYISQRYSVLDVLLLYSLRSLAPLCSLRSPATCSLRSPGPAAYDIRHVVF